MVRTASPHPNPLPEGEGTPTSHKRGLRRFPLPFREGGQGVRSVLSFLALGVSLVLLLALPPVASADGLGQISGRLVDRTTGAAPPSGIQVTLGILQGSTVIGEKQTTTGADGSFSFTELVPDNTLTYRVTAVYAGAPYASSAIVLSSAKPHVTVDLPVYESTGTDPGLRGELAIVVLRGADASRQEVQVAESLRLSNPTDRTFVPGAGGTTGPTSFVAFGLPGGLRSFQPTAGLDPGLLVQNDLGFASFSPITPGEHEIDYEYSFAYSSSSTHSLVKSLPYGAAQLYVLSAPGGPTVSSPALTPGAPLTLQGTTYRMWSAQNLRPGTRVTIELQGLPAKPLPVAALEAVVSPSVLPPVLGLVLLAGLLWQLRRPAPSVSSPEETADA